jgi:adenine deaminase
LINSIRGNLVDLHRRAVYTAEVRWEGGRLTAVEPLPAGEGPFILPGFVDAHVHIESSMVTPHAFARAALPHGTVATVSDPHEIANVCGLAGVDYMIEDARGAGLKIFFGAPSCVPATAFETAGAALDAGAVESLLRRPEIRYLSEMMNYPGVLHGDEEVMRKIAAAKALGKPVDGHAPGLRGEAAKRYIAAGIATDHECVGIDEARDKLQHGMKILIREGSAARNFDALHPLISEHPGSCMLCSDDKHPDDLAAGHIDRLVARAVAAGHGVFDVLQCACLNPVLHYGLPVGLLRPGDAADFIVVKDLESFDVLQTWIDGMQVAENGRCLLPERTPRIVNNFSCSPKRPSDFAVRGSDAAVTAIQALDGQLITGAVQAKARPADGLLQADPAADVLKIAVVNRYAGAPPAVAFIRGFGLRRGAMASTVAHDSHNIVAVGADDESLCRAVNLLIECCGGLSCTDGEMETVLPLSIAGLMSDRPLPEVAEAYRAIDARAKSLGSPLRAPFMTLSFMALLVIPDLKLSDKGLFSGKAFRFVGRG